MTLVARKGTPTRRVAVVAVQAALTVVLLVVLWRVADGAGAVRILIAANPWWLLAAALLLMLHTVLSALRWRVTAAPLGIALTRRQATSEYFLAQLVNTTLPGGVLGDAARAARSRHQANLRLAVGAVVVERAIGQVALLVVLAAAFAATLLAPGGVEWPRGIATLVGAVLAGAVVLAVIAAIALQVHPPRADTRLGRTVDGLRRSVAERSVLRAQVLLSAGLTAAILAAFACCAAAVGAPLPPAAVVAVVPLVLLAMLLPLSIGGWGLREGAAVVLLPIAGITATQSLAASAAFGLVALAAALPGIVAVWVRHRTPTPRTVPGSTYAGHPRPHPLEEFP